MRVFIAVLVLIFSLQSWTKADDIRDFEIEGMSIGDSALKFFDKKEIEERKKKGFIYKKKDFYSATFFKKDFFEIYDNVQLHLKNNDSKYIIYSVGGQKKYPDQNIKKCHSDMDQALEEIENYFKSAKIRDDGFNDWQVDSKVKVKSYYVQLVSGDEIAIECYDYPEGYKFKDDLNIAIDSYEFVKWLHY